MSTEPSTGQTQDPTISVVSAAELVAQAIKRIPALSDVKPELDVIFGAYVQFCLAPEGSYSKDDAIADLEAFFETDPNGVRQAVIEINRVVSRISVEVASEFKELTGANLDPTTLDIAGRVQEEIDEQRELDKLARELLVKIQTIVTKLGIRDTYAEQHASTSVQKNTLLSNIQIWAKNKGLVEEQTAEQIEVDPDWLTDPILTTENADVERIQTKLNAIIRLMSRFSAQSNMKDLVLASLSNMGMPIPEIELLCEYGSSLAYKQLDQSRLIQESVTEDQAAMAEKIDAIKDVKEIYGTVLIFFFPPKPA